MAFEWWWWAALTSLEWAFQLFCCQATNIPVFPTRSYSSATEIKWTSEDSNKSGEEYLTPGVRNAELACSHWTLLWLSTWSGLWALLRLSARSGFSFLQPCGELSWIFTLDACTLCRQTWEESSRCGFMRPPPHVSGLMHAQTCTEYLNECFPICSFIDGQGAGMLQPTFYTVFGWVPDQWTMLCTFSLKMNFCKLSGWLQHAMSDRSHTGTFSLQHWGRRSSRLL